MKKIFFLCCALLIGASHFAQAQLLIKRKTDYHNKKVGSFTAKTRATQHSHKDVGTFTSPDRYYKQEKFFHYGFSLGLVSSRFFEQQNNIPDAIFVQPRRSIGFLVGFVANLRLHQNFDLRIEPRATFYERRISYRVVTGTDTTSRTQLLDNTFVEIPLLLKYKSQLRGTKGMYMIAGVTPSFSVSPQKGPDSNVLRAGLFDCMIEYGFGFDMLFPYFKFSPELRFSHGLVNMLVKDNNVYSRALNRLTTHNVSLIFHFH